MRYARNCDEITVHSFYAIIEKNDFRYIVIGWDEYEEIQIDETKAQQLWAEIYNEYCKLSQDNKTLLFFEITCELIYLENRLLIAEHLINRLEQRKDMPEAIILYAEALSKWKYKIDTNNDIDAEIEKARNNLKISENRIRLKKDELANLNEENEEGMSLSRQLIKMEQALNRDEINPRTTSMKRYIDLINEIKEINAIRSKQNGSELSTVN